MDMERIFTELETDALIAKEKRIEGERRYHEGVEDGLKLAREALDREDSQDGRREGFIEGLCSLCAEFGIDLRKESRSSAPKYLCHRAAELIRRQVPGWHDGMDAGEEAETGGTGAEDVEPDPAQDTWPLEL